MGEPPDFQRALGAAVRARRRALALTQEQLSLRSDLHQRWISNVETGVRNPSYGSLRRLAAALALSTSDLIRTAEQLEGQVPGSASASPTSTSTPAVGSVRRER